MGSGRFIAYYRVSTVRQGQSGLGLEAQRQSVADYLNGGAWKLIGEFTEIETGKGRDALARRPQLDAAVRACRKNKATLVIAKLDRLSRNVAFIAALMESGVDFVAVDMPNANRLTVHILAAVAEHEREMISKRTKEALKAAKARGVALGWANAKRRAEQLRAARKGADRRKAKADQDASNVLPIINAIRVAGIVTLQGIADALNARGAKTARGAKWYPATVRQVMRRKLSPPVSLTI